MRTTLLLSLLALAGCSKSPPTVAPPAPPGGGDETAAPKPEAVAVPAGKEPLPGFLCRPAGDGPFPAVLLLHDAFGLTAALKNQADLLSRYGYVVLAADLYRGESAKTLEDAHILERGLPDDRVLADLKAAVDYLSGRTDVNASAVGAVGLGMGGGYALDAALHDPRLRAVVDCYGRVVTDPRELAPLKAAVFYVAAGKDRGVTLDTLDQFRAAMNKADKRMSPLFVCGQCNHGFLDPASWEAYGKPAPGDVADSWKQIVLFLNKELKH